MVGHFSKNADLVETRTSLVYWFGAVLIWVTTLRYMGIQWSVYENYAYGWCVPLLSVYLFWRRTQSPTMASIPKHRHGAIGAMILLMCVWLVARLFQEANPIWRVASWSLGVVAVGVVLLGIYVAGGGAAARYFSFPVAFFLVSIPWPSLLEQKLIQVLTRLNTLTTVEMLGWLGVVSIPQGNVIEISAGSVGIDEACSGIRSFQSIVMISLFLGEYYRLKVPRRIALIFSGVSLALVCNIIRTQFLVWICDRDGMSALSRWHDPAGIFVLLGCFGSLWVLANWLKENGLEVQGESSTTTRAHVLWSALRSRRFYSHGGLMLVVWVAAVEVGVEFWFRSHESSVAPADWRIEKPEGESGVESLSISENVRRQLLYDEGGSYRWTGDDGTRWQMFAFRWHPARSLRQRVLVSLAKSHRPEFCITASGRTLRENHEPKLFYAGGARFPFRRYVFDNRSGPLHVFYCAWEDGTPPEVAANMRKTSRERLQAALHGTRGIGQRVLEFAVVGYPDLETAELAFQRNLEAWVTGPEETRLPPSM